MDHDQQAFKPDSEADKTGHEPSTRRRILDAALAEFATRGTGGARVDRIAWVAGVNKAMIYYHFSSKEELYHTVLDEFFYDVVSRIRSEVGTESDLDDSLRVLAEHYNDIFAAHTSVLQLMLRELANPDSPVPGRVAQRMTDTGLPQQLQSAFIAGRESGTIRQIDERHAISSFIVMNIGFFMMAPIIQRVLGIENLEQFVRERKATVVDIFLHGVKAR